MRKYGSRLSFKKLSCHGVFTTAIRRGSSYPLLVVARGVSANVSLHRNIPDNHRCAIFTRDANRSRISTDSARDFEKVVLGSLRFGPRVAIGRDLQLRSAAVGIDHLGRKPVGRHAGLGVDGERARDLGAGHELVAGVDDSVRRVGEGSKGVGEEVEVAFVALWALVDDHCGDALASVRDLDATTTVGGVVPSLAAESGAVETRWDLVG
ncbi:hypothetical protein L1887_63287 [Cichorium endivia]|nr:hypothetical protein L1887_63287 [Cichorium endivia]